MLWDKISPQASFIFAFGVGTIIMLLFRFVNTKRNIIDNPEKMIIDAVSKD
jgi:hypothetical protein